jgi:hypothetical protein
MTITAEDWVRRIEEVLDKFNLESLEQESELVYEFFLRYVMLGQSSSIYKSIIKYQEL